MGQLSVDAVPARMAMRNSLPGDCIGKVSRHCSSYHNNASSTFSGERTVDSGIVEYGCW